MPIKYNLTKYDILAEQYHELSQKKYNPLTQDEETSKAEATLIASFSSSHSWQTHKIMEGRNISMFNTPDVHNEYMLAKSEKWKHVRNMDVQEIACMNIRDNMFFIWLSTVTQKRDERDRCKAAWIKLKLQFDEECDGISIQNQMR